MKANKSAKKSAKKNGKPSANGAKPASGGKPQWKKIKLSGKLLSDEGGIGLEGLLGLEVLENAGDVLSVVKEKPQKVKREKFAVKEDLSGDESGSDDERSNKKKRRKKLQKKKKKEEEKNNAKNSADNEPGKFVRMMKADAPAADKAKKPKKGKAAKVAKSVESNEADPNEPKTTINDLIVSILNNKIQFYLFCFRFINNANFFCYVYAGLEWFWHCRANSSCYG